MFKGAAFSKVKQTLESDPSVAQAHPMPDYEGTHVFGIEFTERTKLLASEVTSRGGFSLEARRADPTTGKYGWWERWLFSDRGALNEVWEHARNEGFEFELLAVNQFHPEGSVATGSLTDDQRETLLVAFDHGYFEEPRETSLEELAATLDLSSTAVGGRIRRGINALVRATVVAEAREETNQP